jgi:hypothetical protein
VVIDPAEFGKYSCKYCIRQVITLFQHMYKVE